VLDYLLAERPPSQHREVFLSSRPPHGPLRSKIDPWLGCQLDKAGIVTGRRGAHILRHSLAVHLLRSGETLKSIGDLLGHRRPDTTFIHTKLAVDDLRSVALDPAVVS
jgi:integrase/recombinase XerD